jgi:hypothetical protein
VVKFEGQKVGDGGGVTIRRQRRNPSNPNSDRQQSS